jgi:hypothetical protein
MIVPGCGISLDGEHSASSRARFLLPVRVLAKLFRRLFLANLQQLHATGRLQFFTNHIGLSDRRAFLYHLMPLRKKRWVVLLQAVVLRAGGSARLFVSIHPPRRHLEPSVDRTRHVEQEAADQFVRAERHGALTVGALAAIVLVAERDTGGRGPR